MCINKTNDSDITPLQEAKYASSVDDDDLGEVWATCKSTHQEDLECAPMKKKIVSKPAELFQEDMSHSSCSEKTENWVDNWHGKSTVQWDRGYSIKPAPDPYSEDVEELPW